jgi:hypothetical protein
MGILHRDISDGNVMMLRPGQSFMRREWKEGWVAQREIQDEVLAESEKKLQEVLVKLNRDPTGMLSDFDLHTTHSSATSYPAPIKSLANMDGACPESVDGCRVGLDQPRASMFSTEREVAGSRDAKKRKTNSHSSEPVQPVQLQASAAQQLRNAAPGLHDYTLQAQEVHRVRDFRTVSFCLGMRLYYGILSSIFTQGTPAFMSSRVLKVKLGVKYRHTFLDDLESFFWVIFRSAAAHLDGDGAVPTDDAQEELDAMDQSHLSRLCVWKVGILTFCFDQNGDEMKDRLRSYGNTWASDPIFVNTIVAFGAYLKSLKPNDEDLSKSSPATVFSTVVNIILSQLE